MSDFDISEDRDDELVLLNPEHLIHHHSQTPEDSLRITKLAKKLCRARWPKAYIKIYDGQNSVLLDADRLFILVEYGSKVGNDFDMESWNEIGAFIRQDVVDEIVAKAMAHAGKRPSAALRRRLSTARLTKAKKRKVSPSKPKRHMSKRN
jgi:hypothetical protein